MRDPTARLPWLAERRPFVVAPCGRLDLPLRGSLSVLDYMAHDTVARAVVREFWCGDAGETLLVAPGPLPIAGLILLGYGKSALVWDEAMMAAFAGPPIRLPGGVEDAVVLPPEPVRGVVARPWARVADRFVPAAVQRLPGVRRWHWLDLLEDTADE